MVKVIVTFAALLPAVAAAQGTGAAPAQAGAAPAQAIQNLIEGNRHYMQSAPAHPRQDAGRRSELAKGQHPFAAVLSCSDSRVPPEILFDQGLGDLFVTRVAGNVAESGTTGSLEYAAEHLHVPVIVVLGHEHCGAIQAAVDGGHATGGLKTLLDALRPAVVQARKAKGDLVEHAVAENVILVVQQLRRDPVLSKLVANGELQIVGATYSLDTGEVSFLK